eukprot:scaffold4420_cov187-Amphora_coffeaeformis.AAC.20
MLSDGSGHGRPESPNLDGRVALVHLVVADVDGKRWELAAAIDPTFWRRLLGPSFSSIRR